MRIREAHDNNQREDIHDAPFRHFLVFYAIALSVIAVGGRRHVDGDNVWSILLWPAISYALLALGFWFSRDAPKAPGKLWLAIIFVFLFFVVIPTQSGFEDWAVFALLLACYLTATGVLIRRLSSGGSSVKGRVQHVALPMSLLIGAALVGSSLFQGITFAAEGIPTGAPGWALLARKAQWVTSFASVGRSAVSEVAIPWLQPIFGSVGYAFYLLGLLTTLAITALLLRSRFSIKRMRASAIMAPLTAVISWVTLWLVTDIFWGWHFDLSETPWVAALAFACWLGVLIFGAALLLPVVRGDLAPWRLRVVLIFELPIVAFNFMPLRGYFTEPETPFPGLALLIIGMLIESWVCFDLLARAKSPA